MAWVEPALLLGQQSLDVKNCRRAYLRLLSILRTFSAFFDEGEIAVVPLFFPVVLLLQNFDRCTYLTIAVAGNISINIKSSLLI